MRVFILGAGASYASDERLPLLKGFFDSSLDKDDPDESDKEPPYQFHFLRQFIDWHFLPTERPELNVEEIFLHLEYIIAETSQENPLYGELLSARSQLLQYIERRLRFRKEVNIGKYKELLALASPSDSFLSFNWDVLLTEAFRRTEKFQAQSINQSALLRPSWSSSGVEKSRLIL